MYISPPEFHTKINTFSADKAHSYMLGKNLYQALMGCDIDVFLPKMNGKTQLIHSLDDGYFTHALFKTSEGEQLKSLIQNMVLPNANSRLTVRQVALKLSAISAQFELDKALESIQSTNLFAKNTTLYEHISYLRNQIKQATNPDDLNRLKNELRDATDPHVNTRAQPLMQTLIDADPSKPSGAYKTTIQTIAAMSTRERDSMLQQLFLSTIKQQIDPSKYQHIVTDITKALKIQTGYQHAELYQGHRKHALPVKEHAGRSGDALKTAILSDFKALTKTASNKQQLQTIIADFEQSKQFKALDQAQDKTTLSYNLSKGSVKAFKQIINDAKRELTDEPAPQEGMKAK